MYGERIRELRTAMGMSQVELAKKLGVSQKNISKYELEKLDLNTDTILKLCEIFQTSADYILGVEN